MPLKFHRLITAFFCLLALSFNTAPAHAQDAAKALTLLSTTSTENSGLLNYLIPEFEASQPFKVRRLAMGTGQAIRAAQRGDGDLLLVHDQTSELEFMAAGFGQSRQAVMYNDFVLVGPGSDPAGISAATGIEQAMQFIQARKALFVSRGDNSGTHKAELRLWHSAGIKTESLASMYYREVGAGMGRTLNITAALNAYTLVDRGTWLSFQNRQDLVILLQGDQKLFNQYSVITLNEKRHPHVNHQGAQALANWLVSEAGQAAIADFKIAGELLFVPNALKDTQLRKDSTLP